MKREEFSCYEVIADVDQAMKESMPEGRRYFVLGGIATGALKHDHTYIDTFTKRVYATSESAESTIRDNGTCRDIDILVDGNISKDAGKKIKSCVEEATECKLEVSVFGFEERAPAASAVERLKKRVLSMTSKRTIDESGILRYELFPLEQEVNEESFEQWRLQTPYGDVGMLNPAAHVLAYRMRSITGLRPKDAEKYNQMHRRVFLNPEFIEQVQDGKYRPWRDFADAITLYGNGELPVIDPKISEHAGKYENEIYKARAKALSLFERQSFFVNIAQNPLIQKILNPFIGSA